MAITTSWVPLTPDGADSPSDGDNVIRALKASIADRMRHGGHEWESVAGTTLESGRHKCLDSGDTDVIAAGMLLGEFYIFAGDGTTKLVTVGDSTAVAANKVTIKDTLTLVANGGITTTGGIILPTGNLTLTAGNVIITAGTLTVTAGATTLKATTIGTGGGTLTVNDVGTFAAGLVSSGATTLGGNVLRTTTAVSTTYSVQTGDNTLLITAGSAYDITLPAASSSTGRVVKMVIITGGFAITIKTVSGNIDNQLSATGITIKLANLFNSAVELISNGTAWYMLSNRYIP